MSEVFISYARATETYAKRVAESLRAAGFSVWYDEDLPAHRAFSDVIEERLREAKAVIVMWSSEAVKSDWVRGEADTARKAKKLVQLKVDKTNLPLPFSQIQCVDLAGWSGSTDAAGWRKIIQSIEVLVGRVSIGTSPATTMRTRRYWNGRILASWKWIVAIPAAIILLVAGGVALYLLRPAPPPAIALRVAVLSFDAVGPGQEASSLATSLRDEIIGALSADHIDALSRSDEAASRGPDANAQLARLGARFLVDGLVRSDGTNLTVRVHLDDSQAHTTLWSREFKAPVRDLDALQARVAVHVAGVTRAVVSPTAAVVRDDPDVLAAYLSASDDLSVPLSEQVVARAPGFSAGHTLLALALWASAQNLSEAAEAEAIPRIRKEAKTALGLVPTDNIAYAILSESTSFYAWREREDLLLQGLKAAPDNRDLHREYSDFLQNAGRAREAVLEAQQAKDADPYDFGTSQNLAISLALVDRREQALATITDVRRLAPDSAVFTLNQMQVENYTNKDSTRLVELWKDPAWRAAVDNPQIYDLWLTTFEAIAGHDSAKKATAARALLKAVATNGSRIGADVPLVLTRLGDIDDAFVVANKYAAETSPSRASFYSFDPTGLFAPANAPMRRDRRFMNLTSRLGLLDYWRTSGHWPDFCSEPGLPYDCKAEAAKLASTSVTSGKH